MSEEPPIEIRLNDDGTLDEVFSRGEPVHLEQMDDKCWFLGVGDVQIWLRSSRPVKAYYEDNRRPQQ